MHLQFLRRALACTGLVVGALLSMAGPAQAATVDVDSALLYATNSRADFGTGQHVLGRPLNAGTVTWGTTTTPLGNRETVRLTGVVYMDNLFGGGCARVRLTLYTSPGDTVGSSLYSGSACRTGPWLGDVVSRDVDLGFRAINADRVLITTQYASTSTGPWANSVKLVRYNGYPD